MEKKAPNKLIICISKRRRIGKSNEAEHHATAGAHIQYMTDLWQKGIFWAGGPLADGKTAVEIFAVDTIEEAQKAFREAPHYITGYFYADKYMEWSPKHWPPPTPGIDPSSGKKLDH